MKILNYMLVLFLAGSLAFVAPGCADDDDDFGTVNNNDDNDDDDDDDDDDEYGEVRLRIQQQTAGCNIPGVDVERYESKSSYDNEDDPLEVKQTDDLCYVIFYELEPGSHFFYSQDADNNEGWRTVEIEAGVSWDDRNTEYIQLY